MSTDYVQNYSVELALPSQGKAIKDNRYVKVSQKGTNTWYNFDWKYRQSTDVIYGQMF